MLLTELFSLVVCIYRPSSDWLAVSLTAVLGLSNGLFGSLPIIIAPQKVPIMSHKVDTLTECGAKHLLQNVEQPS